MPSSTRHEVPSTRHDFPDTPSCWGYLLRDEPNAKDLPCLRATVDQIREARPGKLSYINLFPNYANQTHLGTETYDEHVRRFMDGLQISLDAGEGRLFIMTMLR